MKTLDATSASSSPEIEEMPSILAGVLLPVSCLIGIAALAAWEGQTETPTGEGFTLVTTGILVLFYAPSFYWLYCVKKFHDAIWAVSGYNHDISPSKAVAFHFIPFVNIWWVFRWPSAIAKFVNWRCQAPVMRGWVAGVLMVAAVILGRLFGPLGALALFGAGAYIARHMRRAFAAPDVPEEAKESMVPGTLRLS